MKYEIRRINNKRYYYGQLGEEGTLALIAETDREKEFLVMSLGLLENLLQ